MSSFLSKLIGTVLAVVLFILCPVIALSSISMLRTERLSWNYLELYSDIVADKGIVMESDFHNFMTNMSATGLNWDVTITVEKLAPTPAVSGDTSPISTGYVTVYAWNNMKGSPFGAPFTDCGAGDILTVTCIPTSKTFAQSIVETMVGLRTNSHKIVSSKMIRNEGGSLYSPGGTP